LKNKFFFQKQKRELNFADWPHDLEISREFNFVDEGDLDFSRELIFSDLCKSREIREI